jgi:aliphatic nitrilase
MGAEEGILYAECNLEIGISMKLRHDFAGHYNRPDIFQLHINRSVPHLYTVHGPEEGAAVPGAAFEPKALPGTAPALPDAKARDTASSAQISQPEHTRLGDGQN